MSEQNIETIQRWFSGLERGDPGVELCDPEIEISNWAESPIPGPYQGYDGVQRWWQELGEAFEELHWVPQGIDAIDEQRCLTVQRLVGRFRHSGIEMDAAWGAIVTVREGRVLSAIGYASPREAREAAGLEAAP